MKNFFVFLTFILFTLNCIAQSGNVNAIINIAKEKEGHVTINGKAKNLEEIAGSYSYKMVLAKHEDGNKTNSTQGGKFNLSNVEEKTLSTVSVNLTNTAQFEVSLKIFKDDILVAQKILISDATFFENYRNLALTPRTQKQPVGNTNTATIINSITKNTPTTIKTDPTQEQQLQQNQSDDIEIGGLIIDDTRSKIGRDFYEFFYGKWVEPKDSDAFSVIIKELPATRGRASRIAIELDGTVVVERLVQPRQEIIEALAQQAVNIVQQQLSRKKQLNKELESPDQSGSGIF